MHESVNLHDSDKGPRGDVAVLKTLFRYLWPEGEGAIKVRVVTAASAIFLAKAATVTVPIILKFAVDALSVEAIAAIPVALILAYGAARLSTTLFGNLRDAIFARVGMRAIRRSAVEVLTHLHTLSLRFHLERQTGALDRTMARGTSAISNIISITLFNVLPTLFELVMVTLILWRAFSGWFALVTFVTVTAYIAFTVITTEWRLKFRREANALDNKASTRAVDSLLNYETVKAFGNEDHETRAYDEVMEKYEDASVKNTVSLATLNIGQAGIIAIGTTGLMVMAARGIVTGTMTVGDFVMVNTYMIQLAQPLNIFGFVYRSIKQSLVDLEKMFDLLEVGAEVKDEPGAEPLQTQGGEVRFDHVSFAYDPRRPILKDVSFHAPEGHKIAIVGPSGAGKSTIARLLFRFYDVTDGQIQIDEQNIAALQQNTVRAAIGVVPQDTVLFNDTIRYNIGYAKPGATDEEINRAARLAHIDEFIAGLPEGYDTLVGERGLKLSGGEKQRVAIARVILKDPGILLLDEATSALDSHTEKEIQSNLSELARGRTTIVIAHRLSTVQDADEIIVLEQGQVIERGSHNALLKADGAYAALWHKQASGGEGAEPDEKIGQAATAI